MFAGLEGARHGIGGIARAEATGRAADRRQVRRAPRTRLRLGARGEADAESDVHFLVELDPGRSLLDLGGLQFKLKALLGRSVDVVTERGLKTRIRERVLREAVPV